MHHRISISKENETVLGNLSFIRGGIMVEHELKIHARRIKLRESTYIVIVICALRNAILPTRLIYNV